jgi:hypothetical protein
VGADGVCRHPYEAEEVRARLMVAERKRSPAAA